jgi:hypothetical protein
MHLNLFVYAPVARLETRYPCLKRLRRTRTTTSLPLTPIRSSTLTTETNESVRSVNPSPATRIDPPRAESINVNSRLPKFKQFHLNISLQNINRTPNVNSGRSQDYVYKDTELPSYEEACISNTNI